MRQRKQSPYERAQRGFTIPEVLVVIGVIALLIAVLVPALTGALRTGDMTKAMNNLKQISIWMTAYSAENRDFVLPSQFNYTQPGGVGPAAGYPIKVRNQSPPPVGAQYKGTWTDILWTQNGLGADGKASALTTDQGGWTAQTYEYDSPDMHLYRSQPDYDGSPFRSPAPNTRDFPQATAGVPTPFGGPAGNPGDGAQEAGYAGYFAANNFFNADRDAPPYFGEATPMIGRWYTNSQIKSPQQALYLIDSFAGETIEANDQPFDSADADNDGTCDTLECDFRYNGSCLILFLDGHIEPHSPWIKKDDLEKRGVKVDELDRR